jgi:tetratricopeptide (TPR) repeat protein
MLLAQIHEMERNRGKAEEVLRKVIALSPANIDAYAALGSLYLASNKVREGRNEFIRVAEKQPKSVEVPTLVGFLSELLGEPAEAERWYKKALEIQQNAPVAANNLAWLYAEQGQNLDVAVQLAQEANAQLPNRPEVSDTLGWASYKADLITTAIPLFQKSIERNPSNPTYHYHLGLAYLKQRDMIRAKASLQRALSLNPTFANAKEARDALASIY